MSDFYQYKYERPRINIGAVEIIIMINVILFIPYILVYLIQNVRLFNLTYAFLALNINNPNLPSVENGCYWQILTAMFMHGSVLHIFFNMFLLYMFGKPLENRMGKMKFVFFYLVTGILANLASIGFYKLTTNSPVSLLGASGAIFGVLLAFGTYYPDIRLLLFFIIPMKAKWAVLLYAVIELLFEITGSGKGIAHITHLFGFLFAFLYLLIFFRINAIKEMFFIKRYYY
jgi:membrane associated rhomboid family serine protease